MITMFISMRTAMNIAFFTFHSYHGKSWWKGYLEASKYVLMCWIYRITSGQPPQCGVVCLMWYAVFLDYMCLVIKYVIVGVTWHGMKLVKCRRWLIVAACNACLLARCWNRRLLDHLGCCFQPQQPPPNWDSAMSWRLRPGLRPPHPQTSCHNPPSPLTHIDNHIFHQLIKPLSQRTLSSKGLLDSVTFWCGTSHTFGWRGGHPHYKSHIPSNHCETSSKSVLSNSPTLLCLIGWGSSSPVVAQQLSWCRPQRRLQLPQWGFPCSHEITQSLSSNIIFYIPAQEYL